MPSHNKTRAEDVETLLAPCLDAATAALTATLAAHGVVPETPSAADATARFAAVSAALAQHADTLVCITPEAFSLSLSLFLSLFHA